MHHRPGAPYLIAPRYLAGPDEILNTGIAILLLSNGWESAPHGEGTMYAYRASGGLLEAVHAADHVPPGHRPPPASGWEFTARPGPGEMATWGVRFAPATPPELIAALATALTEREVDRAPGGQPHYLRAPLAPEEATLPLEAASWMRDLAQHECAWYAPDQQAVTVTPHVPGQLDSPAANWLFAARRATDNVALWHAIAHPYTPTHLIHALCAALTDPAPVPRSKCPGPEVGALTIAQP
ncbi:DUF317 domain-containing protein [Streptomyces sp. NPDC042319]|uniref:DUF317 domain-containing protein n=1 Tax=Streptomyces sp. NPDC042319 TaxID=3154332 RepID=UPI0033E0EF7D